MGSAGMTLHQTPGQVLSRLFRISSNRFESHSFFEFLHTTALEPLAEVLTLTDVKRPKLVTAIDNGFNPHPSDSHAPSNRELAEFQKMKSDAPKRRVRDSTPAKGQI